LNRPGARRMLDPRLVGPSASRLELATVHFMLRDLLVVVVVTALALAPMAFGTLLERYVADDVVPEP
jgi:hypothetical protein